jgi:hypothetical protein
MLNSRNNFPLVASDTFTNVNGIMPASPKSHSVEISLKFSKACLLGLLYLSQTLPKGYLKYLPILLRENKQISLKELSSFALYSLPELLKPIFAILFDYKYFSSPKNRKRAIMAVQLSIISLYISYSFIPKPTMVQLGFLFLMTNLLISLHDTAVDGLAVQILLPAETALGALGQYSGYKLGGLIVTGLFPVLMGGESLRSFSLAIVTVMIAVFGVTIVSDVTRMANEAKPNYRERSLANRNKISHYHIDQNTKDKKGFSKIFQPIVQYITNPQRVALLISLFLYKAGEHGLDFVWTPMLVDSGISRKNILQSQFLVGNIAALAGAWLGSEVTRLIVSPVLALTACSFLRLIPESMQLYFAMTKFGRNNNNNDNHLGGSSIETFVSSKLLYFIHTHSILENIAGSAITSSMFSFLLSNSDKDYPATSYAFMNTFIIIGMKFGEYFSAVFSHYHGFKMFCTLALFANILFTVLLYTFQRYNLLL